MRHRTLWWAIAGISIAICWTAYFFATPRTYKIALASDYEIPLSEQLRQAIEVITCPALLTGATFHRVIPLYGVIYAIVWLIPLNGVIYAIIGFAVGLVQSRTARSASN